MRITATTTASNATITENQFEAAIDKAIKSLISAPVPWFGGDLGTAEDWFGDVGTEFAEEFLKTLNITIEDEEED